MSINAFHFIYQFTLRIETIGARSLFIGVLMMFLLPTLVNAQNTVMNANTSGTRNSALIDFFLPTIVMEKNHGHRPYLPRYRIEIYRSGRGYYYGMRDVKTLGEISFSLTQKEVEALQAELQELGIWEMEKRLVFADSPSPRLQYEFIVRDKEEERRTFSEGGLQAFALQEAIERAVQSARWRCPYVNAVSQEDYCETERSFLEKAASDYRKWLKKKSERDMK